MNTIIQILIVVLIVFVALWLLTFLPISGTILLILKAIIVLTGIAKISQLI